MDMKVDQLVAEGDKREEVALEAKLASLKKLDIELAMVNLWIVHRKMVNRVAQYSALRVEAEDELRKKLRKAVVSKVHNANTVRPYEYETTDLDGGMLEQPIETTDFGELIRLVNRNGEEHKVTSNTQLFDAWGYIVKLWVNDTFVYAFRKIGTQWASKKVGNNWLFKDKILMDLDEQPVFRADSRIDFVAFDGSVFILDKGQFESAMNFRAGMEKHRDEILKEFEDMGLFDEVDVIRRSVNNHMHKLRKLASVKKNGYYKLPWYVERLQSLNEENGWGLEINEEGEISATEDNVELILTLLNNDRLQSPITEELFDVGAKKPVAES